jgi:isocitrate dehydrogenase
MQDAKESELLLSLHLKATMMKVSDPILFGHCIKIFFREWFNKYGKELEAWGANPNRGLGSVLEVAKQAASPEKYEAMQKDLEECYEHRPWLAMVDSDKGITNLHAPNDIIIGTYRTCTLSNKDE